MNCVLGDGVDGVALRARRCPSPKAQFFCVALARVGLGMARGAAPSTVVIYFTVS